MGAVALDLWEAEVEGDELVINVFCLHGRSCHLPTGHRARGGNGFPILSGTDERGSRRPRPGAPPRPDPVLRAHGHVEVWRLPAETAGQHLKLARRAARELERGG